MPSSLLPKCVFSQGAIAHGLVPRPKKLEGYNCDLKSSKLSRLSMMTQDSSDLSITGRCDSRRGLQSFASVQISASLGESLKLEQLVEERNETSNTEGNQNSPQNDYMKWLEGMVCPQQPIIRKSAKRGRNGPKISHPRSSSNMSIDFSVSSLKGKTAKRESFCSTSLKNQVGGTKSSTKTLQSFSSHRSISSFDGRGECTHDNYTQKFGTIRERNDVFWIWIFEGSFHVESDSSHACLNFPLGLKTNIHNAYKHKIITNTSTPEIVVVSSEARMQNNFLLVRHCLRQPSVDIPPTASRSTKREHKSTLVYIDGHTVLKENNHAVKGMQYVKGTQALSENPKKKKRRVLEDKTNANLATSKAVVQKHVPVYKVKRKQHKERVQSMIKRNQGCPWEALGQTYGHSNHLKLGYQPLEVSQAPNTVQARL